jgi:hypothetical protein
MPCSCLGCEYLFHHFLFGVEFEIITDHRALLWLMKFDGKSERLLRWSMKLQGYKFEIKYRKGKEHSNADALSRILHYRNDDTKQVVAVLLEESANMAEKQRRDAKLKRFFELAKKPNSRFVMKNEVLLRRRMKKGKTIEQLVVPTSSREEVMKFCHDDRWFGGHMGFEKSYKKLNSKFWWPRSKKDFKVWIQTCLECQSRKPNWTSTVGEMLSIPVGEAWDTVGMDIVGPIQPSGRGNRYLVVMTDYLTKWPEVKAVKNIDAYTIAKDIC